MPDPTLRQITMLGLVPRRPPGRTTHEFQAALSERDFDVDLRTIQRDLDKLSGRFPLIHDEGRYRRWYWAPHSGALSLPGHDPFSALSWQLIEQHLRPILPRILQREAEPQFESARGFLESTDAGKYRRWIQRVRILPRSMQLQSPEIESEVVDAVYQGLLESRQLRVYYRSRGEDEPRWLTVHPLAMVVRDSVYYLLVTVRDYTDIRQIVMHRIQRAELLDELVQEPEGFDLDEYIEQGGFTYSHDREIRLVLRFDNYAGQHVIETPLANDQTHRELDDGRIEISAHVTDSEQLRWWLMGFGSGVEVMKPVALRRYMRDDAEALMELYKPK